MKAKLFKKSENLYILKYNFKDGGTTEEIGLLGKLSLKNCQAIERGYDLEDLATNAADNYDSSGNWHVAYELYKAGFQKCLELMGDKKFSEEQVLNAFYAGWISKDKLYLEVQESYKGYLKRHVTQQTEWDVEVEIELDVDTSKLFGAIYGQKPKLDADGCLILKLKSE